MTILPIDELNALRDGLSIHFENGRIRSKKDRDEIKEDMFDFFLIAYAMGMEAANTDIKANVKPKLDRVKQSVNAEVAGETWAQRVDKYYETGGSEYDILRIAETDMTRIYNTAVLDVADTVASGTVMKRWVTMADDRVRDTHDYLEGVAVPYDADFYTFDGDHARAPGLFSKPENVINCRCTLELFRA